MGDSLNTQLPVIWSHSDQVVIPPNTIDVPTVISYAKSLSKKDAATIGKAMEDGHYEMASAFIWGKAMSNLKVQIAQIGMSFVGEILNRPDFSDDSDPVMSLTDYDAVVLSEQLGMFSPSECLRLRTSMNYVHHFSYNNASSSDEEGMNNEEAISIVRTCVQSILGTPKFGVAVQFSKLRKRIISETVPLDDDQIKACKSGPYFFKRTILQSLINSVKTIVDARREHAIGNSLSIIPHIWSSLRDSERLLVGKTYAEFHASGDRQAASGFNHLLMQVKGFDFVPETLRSESFINVANKLIYVHNGWNNFYNEPPVVRELASLGSTIPKGAFAQCMSALMCVKIGRRSGVSNAAQIYVDQLFQGFRKEQWEYYINQCLSFDSAVLFKIQDSSLLSARWIEVVKAYGLGQLILTNSKVKNLVPNGVPNWHSVESTAKSLYLAALK